MDPLEMEEGFGLEEDEIGLDLVEKSQDIGVELVDKVQTVVLLVGPHQGTPEALVKSLG